LGFNRFYMNGLFGLATLQLLVMLKFKCWIRITQAWSDQNYGLVDCVSMFFCIMDIV
jgi:hypothetical protein